MKNDAIVSNTLNRTSVIIKTNKISNIVNQETEELRKTYSNSLPYIKTANTKSVAVTSQKFDVSYTNMIVKDKTRKESVNIVETFAPITLGKTKIRYVRDWVNGSSVDRNSHWVEIMVKEKSTGNNLSLNKPATFINNVNVSANRAVDGNTHYNNHFGVAGKDAIEVDLQQEYALEDLEITVWHYYGDGRIYKDAKIEVSQDKTEWIVLRDSSIDGTYKEASQGMSVDGDKSIELKHQYPSATKSDITTITPMHTGVIGINTICDGTSIVTETNDFNVSNVSIKPAAIKVVNIDENFTFKDITVISKDRQSNNYNLINNYKCASTIVATKLPVNTGGSNGSGGEGLKALDLELIPFNYVKIKLDFADKKVVDVVGLPPGLTLRNGYIDGSPSISGEYNVRILLNNNTFISGKIKVHVLDRII